MLLSSFLPSSALVAAVSAGYAATALALPASSNLHARSGGSPVGPYPIRLNDQWIKVQDGVLELTSSNAHKSDFSFAPVTSDRYDVHGTITGYEAYWIDSFGFFRPVWDESQCVRGVSNTTHATHFYLAPCVWDDADPVYGLQLFHIHAGSQWPTGNGALRQNENYTTDWIPSGETGDTDPNVAYGSPIALTGWRFYPNRANGVRLQAQPKDSGVGTALQFLNETYYHV